MSPWRVVPPASHTVPRAAWYSGSRRAPTSCCYRTGTFSGRVVRTLRIKSGWSRVTVLQPQMKSPSPGLGVSRVRSPLLAASRLIPVRQGTEMFQFPHCPSHALWIQAWIRGHAATWVAPFGDVWFNAWSQLPRHISVRTPSFIGPGRRGIPLVPYFASRMRLPVRAAKSMVVLSNNMQSPSHS
jgi:hypothetical protein